MPLGVAGVASDRIHRQFLRLAEVQRAEGHHPPARHHDRIDARVARRRPERRQERPRKLRMGQSDHYWQASHSGLSIEQNFGSSPAEDAGAASSVLAPAEGTAFSPPALLVDFSAWFAPTARWWYVVFRRRSQASL